MNSKYLIAIIIVLIGIQIFPTRVEAERLFTSGFEMQADVAPVDMNRQLEFDNAGSSFWVTKIQTDIKHGGAAAMRAQATSSGTLNDFTFVASPVLTDMYLRFYFYIATCPAADAVIAAFWDTGVDANEGTLWLEPDCQLHLTDDEVTLDGQGTTVLNTGQWYRIEWNYDAGDQMIVRIDGVEEIDSGTHTGDNVDSISFGLNASTADVYYDDLAINDTNGSTQTSFPGIGYVVQMQPNGDGDNNNCLSGDSTSIDELTPDDDTSFCQLDDDAGTDILDVAVESSSNAGIASTDTVTLVQVGARFSALTAAAVTWNARVKSASGGTVSSGSTRGSATTAYWTNDDAVARTYSLTSYTDPTTGVAWTPTGTNSIDNMQIGILGSDANPDVKVTTLWANVEYVQVEVPSESTLKINYGTLRVDNGKAIIK